MGTNLNTVAARSSGVASSPAALPAAPRCELRAYFGGLGVRVRACAAVQPQQLARPPQLSPCYPWARRLRPRFPTFRPHCVASRLPHPCASAQAPLLLGIGPPPTIMRRSPPLQPRPGGRPWKRRAQRMGAWTPLNRLSDALPTRNCPASGEPQLRRPSCRIERCRILD